MLKLGLVTLGLTSGLVPDGLSHAATNFVERLKINAISEKRRKGRWVVIKRRNIYGGRGADLINFYFRLANIPIHFVNNPRTWCRWEAKCFQMLNGDRFQATIRDSRTLVMDKLPGESLWDRMKAGKLTLAMFKAAGKEYRRAHQLWVKELRGGWSHGDASMTNVIYDVQTDRARLIDFEIMHNDSLPAHARHADDLLVFLLDLVSRIETRHWLPFATTFLQAYGNGVVLRELKEQLNVPTGMALIWWNVRTNFAKRSQINARFQTLRRVMTKLSSYRSVGADRVRKRRRPSTTCHAIKPGTPTSKSRQRHNREMAKAVSPGMPRRSPITR